MDTCTLDRFLAAQEHSFARALAEIGNGRKQTHWMWYIFPQLRGLGQSDMAYVYGIAGETEARAYLAHPVLSARLLQISEALLLHKDKSARQIFGDIDGLKLRSSMTLFALQSPPNSVFHQVLDAFFDGEKDAVTLNMLQL